MKKKLGYILLAMPFIGIFVYTWTTMSFLTAIGVFVLAGSVAGCIWFGIKLIDP